jgi:amidase
MPDLHRLTATDLRALMRDRLISAREVTEAALARIDDVNQGLNAVVGRMDAEALAAADRVDAALRRGEAPGLLAGVPVTVKVNVDQAGQATTNGLRCQDGLIAVEDNPVVANLRKAGAVIVGRTNTPAFSLRWFTRNSLHGQTINPRNPALTPGGSSGGAGAAVAAGLGPIAHGTDIAGSIRYPAYACGVHGLRPSLGRVPAYNATAADRHIGGQLMAVSGPLARHVPDLALALRAMAVRDARDPWQVDAPLAGPPVPRRVALCLAPDGMAVEPEVYQALVAAAGRLEAAGWVVDEVVTPQWQEAVHMQIRLWMVDMRHAVEGVMQAEADPDALFVYDQFRRISPALDLGGLMDTLQARARLTRLWRGFLAQWPLVLCPVSGKLPFENNIDVASSADFDAVIAAQLPQIAPPLMGLPGLALTTDLTGRAPLGVQLLADQLREDLLLEAGAIIAPDPVPIV